MKAMKWNNEVKMPFCFFVCDLINSENNGRLDIFIPINNEKAQPTISNSMTIVCQTDMIERKT